MLVTLSSVRQLGEEWLAEIAVRALGMRSLRAVVTLGDRAKSDAEGLLRAKGIFTEPYLPHSVVLQRAAVSISHAGHGIVSKSMHFGVPMVLVPWDRDQPGVSARAVRLGVAVRVTRAARSVSALLGAIEAVIEDDGYRARCQARSIALRNLDPVGEACRAIERHVGETL